MSVRMGNWCVFKAETDKSIDIFFAAGRPNYSRYGLLAWEDIKDLQRKFPEIHRHFQEGGFVCQLTERAGSAIGINQALENEYNFQAKATGGIIGVTRKKEAVALWDLLKHNKDKCTEFLSSKVNIATDKYTELDNLHHEFNDIKIQGMVKYAT